MTDAAVAREVRRCRIAIAAVFLVLGAWCLAAPWTVIDLTIRPEHRSQDLLVLVAFGAFGAQAMLAGLFAATARFTRRTFLAFGLALLPFFVFDWYFYFQRPLFNALILLDVAGNLVMLALCARAWWILRGPP